MIKRSAACIIVLFLIVSGPTVLDVSAQMPGPISASVPVAAPVPVSGAVLPSGLERIGVVAAAGGKVELTTPGQVGRIAQSGQPIFMGDLVSTDAKGHLQILLLDETVFTIGPNSAITIDKFVYDPKTQGGEIKASIAKGVFRYVSGKIAVKNPNKVIVKLPTATLGFRGTIVGGNVQQSGEGLVGLLGPGDNNDAGANTGSFTIEGEGGDQQNVDRTGFGVGIGEGGGLSGVFQLSEDQINGLTGGLGGGDGGGGGSGGSGGGSGGDSGSGLGGNTNMDNLSGETGALTGDMAGFTTGLSGFTDGLNDLTTVVSQDKNDTGSTSGGSTATTLGSITTLAEMQAVKNITFDYHFEKTGLSLGGTKSCDIFVNINFAEGHQSVGGGNSRVDVYSDVETHYKSFYWTSPDDFTNSSNPFSFSQTESMDKLDLELTVLNKEGGVIGSIDDTAINAECIVSLTGGAVTGTGEGVAPREADLVLDPPRIEV